MNKNEFKKYQLKTALINLSFFCLMIFITSLALYYKELNDILFEKGLFFIIWMFLILALIANNIKYYEHKRKFEISTGVYDKLESKRKKSKGKKVIIFFLLTLINVALIVGILYNNLEIKKFTIPFSTEIIVVGMFLLIFNIAATISSLLEK